MSILLSEWPIVLAAVLSFAWFCLHTFVGGRLIATPLRQTSEVNHIVMATMWMCWHMVTVTLFLMGVFFVMGLIWGTPYVVAGTLLAGAIAAAGLAAAPLLDTTYRVLPQGWLFVPIAVLECYALVV